MPTNCSCSLNQLECDWCLLTPMRVDKTCITKVNMERNKFNLVLSRNASFFVFIYHFETKSQKSSMVCFFRAKKHFDSFFFSIRMCEEEIKTKELRLLFYVIKQKETAIEFFSLLEILQSKRKHQWSRINFYEQKDGRFFPRFPEKTFCFMNHKVNMSIKFRNKLFWSNTNSINLTNQLIIYILIENWYVDWHNNLSLSLSSYITVIVLFMTGTRSLFSCC